jgi:hypothetical protein
MTELKMIIKRRKFRRLVFSTEHLHLGGGRNAVAEIPKDGFKSRDDLYSWLDGLFGKKFEFARVLAIRSAHRAAPYLEELISDTYSQDPASVLRAIRCNLVARASIKFPSEQIIAEASRSSGIAHFRYRHHSLASTDSASYAAAAAGSSESAFDDGAIQYAASACHQAADNLSHQDFYEAVTIDAQKLLEGTKPLQLLNSPIWPQSTPKFWDDERRRFGILFSHNVVTITGSHLIFIWKIWVEWFESVFAGQPAFNLPEAIAKELEIRIALGDGRSDFWDRKPELVNADVTKWLTDAKALAELHIPAQGSGLKFGFLDKMLRVLRGQGLGSDLDDQARITSQLPILLQLVVKLQKRFAETDTPHSAVCDSLANLKITLQKNNLVQIGVTELFSQILIFRDELDQAQNPAQGINAPPLTGSDLASAKSIATIGDLIVLGTEEGQKLFADAEQSDLDAGEFDKYRALELELLDLIAADGRIMEPQELALLKQVLLAGNRGPVPRRAMVLAQGSFQNFINELVLGGLIGTTLLFVVINPMAVAGLAFVAKLLAGDVIKESDAGKAIKEIAKREINDHTAIFVLKHEKLIRDIAAKRRSFQPLLELLDKAVELRAAAANDVTKKAT